MKKRENMGVIRSLFLFFYMPCILTLLFGVFGKTFVDMGMPPFLLILFWIAAIVIIIIYKYQEVENIKRQWKKRNFW